MCANATVTTSKIPTHQKLCGRRRRLAPSLVVLMLTLRNGNLRVGGAAGRPKLAEQWDVIVNKATLLPKVRTVHFEAFLHNLIDLASAKARLFRVKLFYTWFGEYTVEKCK